MPPASATASPTPADAAVWDLPRRLQLENEIEALKDVLRAWAQRCDPEVREMVSRQLGGRAKYFRPVTVFACHAAVRTGPLTERVLKSAAALELMHNVSLVVDDILDRSRFRRGSLSLHCRYGFLPALMTSGYMTVGGLDLVADDAYAVRQLAELMQRLGAAECRQWRLRRRPLGVEDRRGIAGEDTGSMFEICARLGTRDDRLRKFGRLLGTLYHGCDDVADVRGGAALGGGSERDIQDGILTLPAAIAIRDPETAVLFQSDDARVIPVLTERLAAALPEAERMLDRIAEEADLEATRNASRPEGLRRLIEHTRALSRT